MANDIGQEVCDSLSGKLAGLELTDDEAKVLEALLAAAGDAPAEVQGFELQGVFPSRSVRFMSVKCDVHPWMLADTARPTGVVINHEEQY